MEKTILQTVFIWWENPGKRTTEIRGVESVDVGDVWVMITIEGGTTDLYKTKDISEMNCQIQEE